MVWTEMFLNEFKFVNNLWRLWNGFYTWLWNAVKDSLNCYKKVNKWSFGLKYSFNFKNFNLFFDIAIFHCFSIKFNSILKKNYWIELHFEKKSTLNWQHQLDSWPWITEGWHLVWNIQTKNKDYSFTLLFYKLTLSLRWAYIVASNQNHRTIPF